MKILNTEIETDFDYNDADDAERFEKVMKETGEKLSNITEEGKTRAEVIRETCEYIFECFDKIFGEETHKKIFKGKCNLIQCIDAYDSLMEEMIKQNNESFEKATKFTQKYSPNRATRRTKK